MSSVTVKLAPADAREALVWLADAAEGMGDAEGADAAAVPLLRALREALKLAGPEVKPTCQACGERPGVARPYLCGECLPDIEGGR